MSGAFDRLVSVAKASELPCPAYDRLLQYVIPQELHSTYSVSQCQTPPVVMHSDMWATAGAILRDMHMDAEHWRHAACAAQDLMAMVYAEDSADQAAVQATAVAWFTQSWNSGLLSRNGRLTVGGFALTVVACTLALLRHLTISVVAMKGLHSRPENDTTWMQTDAILEAQPVQPFAGWHMMTVAHVLAQTQTQTQTQHNKQPPFIQPTARAKPTPQVDTPSSCLVCPTRCGSSALSEELLVSDALAPTVIGTVAHTLSLDLCSAHQNVGVGVSVMWPTSGICSCAKAGTVPVAREPIVDYPVSLASVMVLTAALEHIWEQCIIQEKRVQIIRSMLVGHFYTHIPTQNTKQTSIEHEVDENRFLAQRLRGLFVHSSCGVASITLPPQSQSNATTNTPRATAKTGTESSMSPGYTNGRADFDSSSDDSDNEAPCVKSGQAMTYTIVDTNGTREEYDPECAPLYDPVADYGLENNMAQVVHDESGSANASSASNGLSEYMPTTDLQDRTRDEWNQRIQEFTSKYKGT